MGWVKFPAMVAADPANPGVLVQGASGQVFGVGDTTFASPLPVRELSGVPLASIEASPLGLIDEFEADVPDDGGQVVWKSGVYVILLTSYQHVLAVADGAKNVAEDAHATATQLAEMLDEVPAILPPGGQTGDFLAYAGDRQGQWAPPPSGSGGGSGITGAPSSWPSEFPPSSHSHTSGQINDSTTVGRQVLTAASQAAARTAIGAGTGNGNSNLQVGPSGSDAAAGNHSHAGSAIAFTPGSGITATNVQTAIEQAAAMGGGGVSQVLVWRYTSGAWPALPASKPAGVLEVRALGPTYPTTVPSWLGLTADKVPLSYSKVAVA